MCLCVCVCLSVTTITKKIVDGFVPNFTGRFLWGKGRPSSCFVTIGCTCDVEVTVKISVNRLLFTFYTSNSRCAKCCQVLATKKQISLSRGVVLSQSTFNLVYYLLRATHWRIPFMRSDCLQWSRANIQYTWWRSQVRDSRFIQGSDRTESSCAVITGSIAIYSLGHGLSSRGWLSFHHR